MTNRLAPQEVLSQLKSPERVMGAKAAPTRHVMITQAMSVSAQFRSAPSVRALQ